MFGYPDFLMYKLHHRRARCLKGFGLDAEAAEAFREALKVKHPMLWLSFLIALGFLPKDQHCSLFP